MNPIRAWRKRKCRDWQPQLQYEARVEIENETKENEYLKPKGWSHQTEELLKDENRPIYTGIWEKESYLDANWKEKWQENGPIIHLQARPESGYRERSAAAQAAQVSHALIEISEQLNKQPFRAKVLAEPTREGLEISIYNPEITKSDTPALRQNTDSRQVFDATDLEASHEAMSYYEQMRVRVDKINADHELRGPAWRAAQKERQVEKESEVIEAAQQLAEALKTGQSEQFIANRKLALAEAEQDALDKRARNWDSIQNSLRS